MTSTIPTPPAADARSSPPQTTEFILTADEIFDLLSGTDEDYEDDELWELDHAEVLSEPSVELQRVAQNISGQYVDVLCHFASQVFAGHASAASNAQVRAGIDALQRLATAANNQTQLTLLQELTTLIAELEDIHKHNRSTQRQISQLHRWIPAFADTLNPEVGERFRSVVSWKAGSLPLLEELKNVRGIGPRRLTRLYSAGLFTIETVANADPKDVAEVTGLPKNLAERVVNQSQAYAVSERERCLREMRTRVLRLRRILVGVNLDMNEELLRSGQDTLSQLNAVIDLLRQGEPL